MSKNKKIAIALILLLAGMAGGILGCMILTERCHQRLDTFESNLCLLGYQLAQSDGTNPSSLAEMGITETMLIDPFTGKRLEVEPFEKWVYGYKEPHIIARQKESVAVFWWPFSEKRQYAVYSNASIRELVSGEWVPH